MPKLDGNARERILDEALVLFSEKGYAATTMRDIADKVGIKAASLYNHFRGKRELFDALIKRETEYVERQVREAGAMARPDDDASAYANALDSGIQDLVWKSYAPFFEDARIALLMRMLAANRYGSETCGRLYQAIFIDRPLALQKTIYNRLIEDGAFAPCDTSLAAMEFHGPMLMLMEQEAPSADARAFCLRHVEQFNKAHRKDSRR